MQTPEQAKEFGEKLKRRLLEYSLDRNDLIGLLDGSKFKEDQAQQIETQAKFALEEIRPMYEGKKTLFYSGRAARNFDFELKRLWIKSTNFYVNSVTASVGDIILGLDDASRAVHLNELRSRVRDQVVNITAPLLEELECPGDDFFLLIHALTVDPDINVIDKMSGTKKTPFEISTAFFAMFGLLIQAQRAKLQGDSDLAYSFLMDANYLIGMNESSRYVIQYSLDVAKKRHAKDNSAKSRSRKEQAQHRVRELFFELRQCDAGGAPLRWKTAEAAFAAVWAKLEKEAQERPERIGEETNKKKPDIRDSGVRSLCREMHRLDKDGNLADIRIEAVQIPTDGNEWMLRLISHPHQC